MLSLFSLSSLTLLLSHNQATSLQHILAQSLTLSLSHPLRLTANRLYISLSSQTGSRAHIQHIYDTFICHTLSLASVQGPPRNSASRIGTEESNLKACHPQARSARKSLARTSTAPLLTTPRSAHFEANPQIMAK